MLLVMLLCLNAVNIAALSMTVTGSQVASAEDVGGIQRAPIIGWRYKTVNDRLYRRLYNYSTQEWIGEWETF